jgi:hypothetical protein
MLKYLLVLFISFPALACLGVNIDGKLAVDGETYKFNRTFKLAHEEMIPAGPYIVTMTVTHPEGGLFVKYKVEEKKGTKLTLITKGEEEELEIDKSRDIMAKGEPNQPNSIITIKLKDI